MRESNLHIINSQGELDSKIAELDTPVNKVIIFKSHGYKTHQGLLGNRSEADPLNYFAPLSKMKNKANTTIDLMGICYQHKIELPLFRHVLTTTDRAQTSSGTLSLDHGLSKVYVQANPTKNNVNDRNGLFQLIH